MIGRIPVRSRANAWGPVPGWTDDHEWRDDVPYDALPRVENPDGGLIVTANQRIVGDDYPHYLGLDYARPDRAIRLHDRLDDASGCDAGAMADVHRDRVSRPAAVWAERLSRLDGTDEWERLAIEALRAWDGVMDTDSVAAAVYMVVRDATGRLLAHDPRLAALRAPVNGEPTATFAPLEMRLWPLLTPLLARDDPLLLRVDETWDDVLSIALSDGVGVLRTVLGDEPAAWRWGALHMCSPRHPLSAVHPETGGALDPPGVEMGGEWDTVFSAAHPAGSGFGVTTASVARYVFDLDGRRASAWVVPLGASGSADDRHFADQQRAWADGVVVPVALDVEQTSEPVARLRPKSS
jgi:penicillin amidase